MSRSSSPNAFGSRLRTQVAKATRLKRSALNAGFSLAASGRTLRSRGRRSVSATIALGIATGVMLLGTSGGLAEEGMYPISELHRLPLQDIGIELTASEIFNPSVPSLVDGICRVNGCTGSFISKEGLIVTNHHCAYEAIQKASTPSRDLLKDGFVAKSRAEEVPAPGYVVRITEQYLDVSEQVLEVLEPGADAITRAKAIEKRRKEIEKQAEEDRPGLRAEVAEMFTGKTYVLFLYTYLKDVRLVFAPPESVGAFGGDFDNWEWPRHTGDFTFMRAYTAPDGSSAEYSQENIPYQPKKPVVVSPKGALDGDAVFILGYPGRTLRQRTATYFQYEEEVRLPAIVESYAWQMKEMEAAWANNREVEIKLASRYKSLSNVEKRSRGQLQGLKRAQLTAKRFADEEVLKAFIAESSERQAKYGNLIPQLDAIYADMTKTARTHLAMGDLRTACRAMAFAFTIVDAVHELQKPDLERESAYMDRNLELTKEQLRLAVSDWVPTLDRVMLKGTVDRLKSQSAEVLPAAFASWLDSQLDVEAMFQETRLGDSAFIASCLAKNPSELASVNDPFIQAMLTLYPAYLDQRNHDKALDSQFGDLYRELQDVRIAFLGDSFVPDANATLRLTYGRVQGDKPADAISRYPFTTFKGVLEKSTGVEPFTTPKLLVDGYAQSQDSPFKHPDLNDIPVALLYSTDTTGGNSGSPVFNGRGELIGVNFDRTYQATINDFAWNADYSRSIGVDVRYMLWVTSIYGADYLFEEMGIQP